MAANGTMSVCHGCGNKIIGVRYTHTGKSYCYDCFQQLQAAAANTDAQKQAMYAAIREIYGVSEIPEEVISALDREIRVGKKPSGIIQTLRYYFQIEGHQMGNIGSLVYVVRDFYESAKQYQAKIKRLKEANDKVDMNVPPVHVTLKTSQLEPQKRSYGYRMEDL